MIHTRFICEPEDGYLAAFTVPKGDIVSLVSEEFPSGWALKGGQTYRFKYDDVTGDVNVLEFPMKEGI